MPILAPDTRSLGQRLNDLAGRVTAMGAEVDATIAALQVKPLNLTVTDIVTDGAILHWTPIAGSTAYVVGRDGKDNRGNPPAAFFDPATADRRQYVWLLPKTKYRVFVLALPSGVGQAVEFTTGG